MSKWGIFLNNTRFCVSERGTGNRPCDLGSPCGLCHFNNNLKEQFKKEEPFIDESKYCKCCGHELRPHEKNVYNGYCETCLDLDI